MLLSYLNVTQMFTTTLWGWNTKVRLSQNVKNIIYHVFLESDNNTRQRCWCENGKRNHDVAVIMQQLVLQCVLDKVTLGSNVWLQYDEVRSGQLDPSVTNSLLRACQQLGGIYYLKFTYVSKNVAYHVHG